MKRPILIAFLIALPFSGGFAQESGKSLASTLEVYVFPAAGQATDQQSKDEAECYSWAASNTGTDPFELEKQSAQQAQQTEQQAQQAKSATQGAGVKGAAKGAAAGALIGEIYDGDSSQGAAYGAAAGCCCITSAFARCQPTSAATGQRARRGTATGNRRTDRQLQEGIRRLPRGQGVHGKVMACLPKL